jgi:hypothetical protein
MIVRGVIVDNQMHCPRGWGLAVDLVEEADELLMPVAARALTDDDRPERTAISGFDAACNAAGIHWLRSFAPPGPQRVAWVIADLQAAINRSKQTVWDWHWFPAGSADPNAIIEKVHRGKQVLESIH